MGSFLIGTGVTIVTFYIALIYGSIAIGLIGFAELVLMLLACLYLLIYCRHITADIRIPLTVAEKGKKVTVQLTVDQTMLFPAAKVRYRVRCRNTFAGYARNFWWNGAGLMRGMQCMEKRVVLSHVGSYEYELVKVRIYDLTGLFYVHKKIKRFADIQVLPELDAVAVQVSERVRRYFGEAESYDDFQPGTDVSQIFDVREYRPGDRLPQMAGKGRHMRRSREAYAETFLTIAADLVYSMMDAGCPHYVAWQEETEIKRLRVEDEESVYLFLMQFMECQKETAGSLRQRYEQSFFLCWMDRHLRILVEITGDRSWKKWSWYCEQKGQERE